MKILFYSIKGGQGKTTHAVWYAKHLWAKLLTNDFESGTADVYGSVLEPGQIVTIAPGEEIKVSDDENIVFDFGWWVESRVLQATEMADICVVPIYYQSTADLMPAVKTILTLEKHNENIVILINNTALADAKELQGVLAERFPNYRIFIVNHSRYIARLADEGKTVSEMMMSFRGLHRHMIKPIKAQIESFYEHLDVQEFFPNYKWHE